MSSKKETNFNFKAWNITVCKSHILPSKCSMHPALCSENLSKSPQNDSEGCQPSTFCLSCRYEKELELPQLPEMTFGQNTLMFKHKEKGFGIEFTCLDALKLVEPKKDLVKLPAAKAWRQSRADCEHMKEVIKPFDWTYTTSYQGTLILSNDGQAIQELDTDKKLDYEKLKRREKILFFEDIRLFEDELADNGCAIESVRIRVMESGFFVLLRFFLRVDGLLVRINDTRIHYESDKDYLIKEYSSREANLCDLKVSTELLINPDELWSRIPIVQEKTKLLQFPS